MHQKLTILGNLGGDPELRHTQAGKAVVNFSVATNRKWTDGAGQQQEETVWIRVSVWGNQAEACNKYLHKGSQVFCEGRLTVDKETGGPRIWTTQAGETRASYEMSAFEVKFLGGRDDSSSAPTTGSPGITEDEIPF